MNLQDKYISLQFYNHLCDIIGSQDVVKTRRDVLNATDKLVKKLHNIISISSGSKAEGIDLKGSDYDQMIIFKHVRVCESLSDVQSNPNEYILYMDTKDTNPGFTKLKLLNKADLDIDMIHAWCENAGEQIYISSKRFREYFLNAKTIIHGPCQSSLGGEYDRAMCFRCKEWITSAQKWIHRSRTTWPDYTLVTSADYRLQLLNVPGMALIASELSCFFYVCFADVRSISVYSVFKCLVNNYKYLLNRELCKYMISVFARKSIQSSALRYISIKNKTFYRQYQLAVCKCKISLQSDSISSWLMLASLFYKCKRFHESLDVINYSLSWFNPDKIYLHIANRLAEQTVFKKIKQRFGLLLAFKHLIVEDVCFRHPFCLLPDELIPLITGYSLYFSPVVYSYLLQFLCCYHLGDYRGKHKALYDFELTIGERLFMFPSLDIVRTMI
ncbi:unnamed protein product [Mytilus coruscus]|uniref:Uncharacterized protein n=1 Tax=Mytilus coruscus TaxID=42192 RepID=A0A6J8EGT6_MYTCO|nr:unnamed protein product [Mytilus coruscus]